MFSPAFATDDSPQCPAATGPSGSRRGPSRGRGEPLAEVAMVTGSGKEACEEQLIQGRGRDAGECVYQKKKQLLG